MLSVSVCATSVNTYARYSHVHESHECIVVDTVLDGHSDSCQCGKELSFDGVAIRQLHVWPGTWGGGEDGCGWENRRPDIHDDSLDQSVRVTPSRL
jgi:hypothetical protein